MNYELDDLDRELIAKLRHALIATDNWDAPMRDELDEDDLKETISLLLNILDAESNKL